MRKINGWYLFVLNSYWIGLSFMWNSLHVTILPAVLLKYIPETQKNTWLGLLTFFGLILAMLIQPLSGAISDRWGSRIGKRRPFVLLGTAGDLLFLGILGFRRRTACLVRRIYRPPGDVERRSRSICRD